MAAAKPEYETETPKTGKLLIEGKTKQVYEIEGKLGEVLVRSKDRITAGDGARADDLEGKAAISTLTNCRIYNYLNAAGVKTHFIKQVNETEFVARHCDMIPIEWVTRRVATGSFLKRNVGVPEGYVFLPVKSETFFKDDANHDPQWSTEQLVCNKLKVGNTVIGVDEVEYMTKASVLVFEVLERAWAARKCTLVDMKVEFGIDVSTHEILLADVIDSDSWRLWPGGDKASMKDKQVYRDLKNVTPDALKQIKSNFKWVAEQLEHLIPVANSLVVVLMGSESDLPIARKIQETCYKCGVPCNLRVTSAHKSTSDTLNILAQYEGLGCPVVFVAVAGRSNGLGPVLAGNTSYPVINCPPIASDWGAEDIWSSLRLPSGLACTTIIYPEGAAQAAMQILGMSDYLTWSRLRTKQLNRWLELNRADKAVSLANVV